MTLRTLAPILALALVSARPAAAQSHKLLVLQSEGRADAATRHKIDVAIVKLAAATEPQATAGELNFTDAATAVGCQPETPACKDEVLGMLAVDEMVITTVAPKPGGLEITVRRVARGGTTRDATMLLATGAPADKLDDLAPLFRPTPAPPPAPLPTAPEPRRSVVETDRGSTVPANHRNLQIAGMAGGGVLVVLGLVMWSAANGVQSDIDKAPTTNRRDLEALQDLESRGDDYASLGNLFVISGLAVGGVATYFFIKDRRAARSTASARLVPAVLDHGAGLVLTFGGTP
jgi:hypothetical protein